MLAAEGLVVLLAFLVACACISPFPDGAIGVRWAVLSVGVPTLVIVSRTQVPWIVIAALALPLAWSPDPIGGVELWWSFVLLALVAAAGPTDLTRVYWAIGCGLAVNSAFAALQWIGFEPVDHVGGWTVSGLFFNKAQQNNFIALAVIGLLSLRDWRAYLLAAWCAFPMFAPTLSRGPLVALGMVGLVLLWRRSRGLAAAAACAAVLAVLWMIGQPGRLTSNADRLVTWIDAGQNLTAFGHGLGSFRWAYPEMEFAHNDGLQIAYELGIPGLIAFGSLICISLRAASHTERLILMAFLVEGLFGFPLYWPTTGFLAALCVGSALRRHELRRSVFVGEHIGHAGQMAEGQPA